MKKITYLFILIVGFPAFMLAQCPGSPPAGYTCIPDASFELRLIQLGYDNSDPMDMVDGLLDNAEAAAIPSTDLVLNGEDIADFTGIEAFVNILTLNINYNTTATTIDLTANTLLEDVSTRGCGGLTSIDVTGLTALEILDVRECSLSALDLSTNTALLDLNARYNQLIELDLSANTALTVVDCSRQSTTGAAPYTTLTNVDMSGGDRSGIIAFNSSFNANLVCVYVDDPSAIYIAEPEWVNDGGASYCMGSLSVEDQTLKAFAMYPNPARNEVFISSKENASVMNVYSISGKLVLTKDLSFGENRVNISPLSSGLYLASFTSDNKTETKKLVIN